MKKAVPSIIVIVCQLLIVGLFFGTVFNDDINLEKHVSTIHNENLDKIATSVSLLFKDEEIPDIEEKMEDLTLEELPSIEAVNKDLEKKTEETNEEKKDEVERTILIV